MLKLISKAPQKLTVFDKSNDFNDGFDMAYFNLQVYKKAFSGILWLSHSNDIRWKINNINLPYAI